MYRRPHIEQGIPEEAFDLECPDEDLKASVLKEFIHVDEKYLQRLNELEQGHDWTLRYGWGSVGGLIGEFELFW